MRACLTCHWAGLPHRDICPQCRGQRWYEVGSVEGVVFACTSVTRSFGVDMTPPRHYALVKLALGGTVISHNPQELSVGTPVTVDSTMNLIAH